MSEINCNAQGIQKAGEIITLAGMGGLFVSAIAGSIICDVMIFIAIMKESERHDRDGDNQFITGYLMGTMMSNNNNRPLHQDAASMMAASVILSAIAIALAFHYGYPTLGFGLIYAWSGSAAIVLLGLGVNAAGKYLETSSENMPRVTTGGINMYPVAPVLQTTSVAVQPSAYASV
jgi:hypothetical protein